MPYIDACQYTLPSPSKAGQRGVLGRARRSVEGMQRGSAAAPFDGGRFRFPSFRLLGNYKRMSDCLITERCYPTSPCIRRQNAVWIAKSDDQEISESSLFVPNPEVRPTRPLRSWPGCVAGQRSIHASPPHSTPAAAAAPMRGWASTGRASPGSGIRSRPSPRALLRRGS